MPTQTQITRVHTLYRANTTYKDIAKDTGLNLSQVIYICSKGFADGSLKRRMLRGKVRRKALRKVRQATAATAATAGLPAPSSLRIQALTILRAEMATMTPMGRAALQTLHSELN